MRNLICPGHNNNHQFTGLSPVAGHDVTKHTFMVFLIICLNAQLASDFFYRLNSFVNFMEMQQAFIRIDNFVAARLEEACDQLPVLFANRNLCTTTFSSLPILVSTCLTWFSLYFSWPS